MPGNQVTNASMADGISAWSGSAGVTLSVDDNLYGYDGRIVLVGTTGGQDAHVTMGTSLGVTSGQTLEAFAHHAHVGGTSQLVVQFAPTNAFAAITTVNVPLVKAGNGDPRLGLAKSFNFSHGRIVAPISGFARLSVRNTAVGAGIKRGLVLKPYLEILPSAKTKYRCWDPGPHINPDLNIPRWPADLPHIKGDGFSVPVIPARAAWAGDKGVEIYNKLTNAPWYRADAQIRGDQETHAILDRFFRTSPEPFWFVRPDTFQLCRATWRADGEPSMSGVGPDKVISFGLQLSII